MNRKQLISAIVFCLYLAAVAYLCFAKPETIPQLPQTWLRLPADKVGHFIMFLPFPALAFMAFEAKGMTKAGKWLLLATIIIAGMGMAVGTEHIQAQLEYRSAEGNDLLADGLGLVSGGICAAAYIFIRRNK